MSGRIVLCLLLLAATVAAAPMTLKELEFLVRQRTPEAEVLKEARERRLVAPITGAVAGVLKEGGASDSLLRALNAPEVVLSPEESEAERQRQMAARQRTVQAVDQDHAEVAARMARDASIAAHREKAETMRRALNGNLVRLEGDHLRPAESDVALKEVRVIAVYYSSLSSLESRRITPKLIDAYQRLKKQYPTQFELVWVSCDRDEFNMGLHMRTLRMPWLAARFGTARDTFTQYAGKTLPWLVAIANTGEPLTENAVTKIETDPDTIIQGIEYLLGQLK